MTFKQLKIAAQLGLLASVVLAGFAVIGGIYWQGVHQQSVFRGAQDEAEAARTAAASANYQFLDTRRHEKDFLARREDKYVALHANSAKAVRKSLESLKSMP